MPRLILFVCLSALLVVPASAQLATRPDQAPTAAPLTPNSNATYQQLRQLGYGGEAVVVSDLVLERDAGRFTFKSGSFCFLAPVEGRVTGAVFVGEGSFSLTPPIDVEKRILQMLTKTGGMEEDFSDLVLRFTDSTYDDIKKASSGAPGGAACSQSLLNDHTSALRKKLKYNLAGRLLQDVLGNNGGLFMAFIHGRKHNGKLVYAVDPRGVGEVSAVLPIGVEPEEVALFTWDEQKLGIWAAFHHAREYQNGRHVPHPEHALIDIQHQDLDVSIEGNARLSATALTTFKQLHDGVRVAPFDLFPTLRVSGVWDSSGNALDFIQEDKDDDAQFSVILPRPLTKDEAFTIRTAYAGKDAVTNEGGGNYYPIARSTWYPNTRFGDYATYDLRFSIPKHLKMVATGARVSDVVEGDKNLTVWKSEAPQAVAGFHLGRFTRLAKKMDGLGIEIESFANTEDANFAGYAAGKGMMEKAMAEAELSMMLYTDYFGPIAYKRVAMTQQMALSFGQAWPGLVWLPRSAFVDSTIRYFAGMDDRRGYFKIVGPHEVAHQWWGHTVGFNSYRDQWMSEGFSELSASLYIQLIQKKPKEFIEYWKDQLDLLTEKNAFGFRAADAGPVTMGYRLYTDKTADIPRRLIYPKGGFILHMVRMMMWDPRTGDERFKAMLREFVSTYANRAATTEDFKAVLEKHITPEMDVDGNRSMDWFFNQFVYGTALPSYKFKHSFTEDPQQGVVLDVSITQSNVDEDFRMRVPIYLELADGRVLRLGSAGMKGNTSFQQKVPLGKVPRPKRAMLNHYYDVMAQVSEVK